MKKILIVTSLIVFSNTLYSQGFIWNAKVEAHHKTYDRVSLSRSAMIPTSASLEKYLPYIQNQGNSDMCAAYSIATCRTIVYAKNNNLTDIDEISAESYSPYYIYHRARTAYAKEWDGGMMMYMDRINQFGYAKMKDIEFPYYYPFTDQSLWNFSIPSHINLDIESVREDKFSSIISILPSANSEDTIADITRQIKTEIAQERPIIFGMDLPFHFNEIKDYWDPMQEYDCIYEEEYCDNKTSDFSGLCPAHKPDDWKGGGHTMVLIAYDDEKYGGAFQIVNSWGEDWGVGGKTWFKYKDFVDYAVSIQSLDKNNNKTIFDIDNNTQIQSNKKYTKESGLETKSFLEATNYKWMMRVPILGMDAGKYSGEITDGLKNGRGTYNLINGIKYNGEWKDDKMHGEGIYTFKEYQYKGQFKDASLDGEGILIKLNKWGDVIEKKKGIFKDGDFIKGEVTIDRNGYKYVGEWSEGDRNGYGTLFSFIRDINYVGEFKDGYRHGHGTLTYPNGAQYVGQWKDGKEEGQGSYSYANGGKYLGDWKDGKKEGQGSITFGKGDFEGEIYSGEWKNNMPNGKGKEITNEYVFDGEFKDWIFHGQGKKTYVDGTIEEGEWNEGLLVKKNIIQEIESLLNSILKNN